MMRRRSLASGALGISCLAKCRHRLKLKSQQTFIFRYKLRLNYCVIISSNYDNIFISFNQDIAIQQFTIEPKINFPFDGGEKKERSLFTLRAVCFVFSMLPRSARPIHFPKPICKDYKHIRFMGDGDVVFALTCGLKSFQSFLVRPRAGIEASPGITFVIIDIFM